MKDYQLPKDALIDNLIGMCATRCGHCTPCVAAKRLVEFDARCEALTADLDRMKLSRDLALEEAAAVRVQCEALAAERDRLLKAMHGDSRMLAHFADNELAKAESRCQHLEQAVKDYREKLVKYQAGTVSRNAGPVGLAEIRGIQGTLAVVIGDLDKALASLLPAQEEPTQTDENRVSFAHGYSQAIDDVAQDGELRAERD